MTARRRNCDVLVLGGGPVGLLAALGLKRLGQDVVLVERGPAVDPAPARPDPRGYALARGTVQILDDLGLWAALEPVASPIRSISVSQQGGLGRLLLEADSLGEPALGWVTPAARIRADWMDACQVEGVTVLDQSTFFELGPPEGLRRDVVVMGPEGQQRWSARLIVAADGADSALRSAAGIEVAIRDHASEALVFDVQPARAHSGRAFERFTEEGPLALLPLRSGALNVVWVGSPEATEERAALDPQALAMRLQEAFGWSLGRLRCVGPCRRFPLRAMRARRLVASRVALVGNAAHALHPVAGQGLNLALRDVATLLGHLAGQPDPGVSGILEAYARDRMPDIRQVSQATDFLAGNLRWSAAGPVSAAAGLLAILDRMSLLKRRGAERAMGFLPMPRYSLRKLGSTPRSPATGSVEDAGPAVSVGPGAASA